MKPQRPPWTLPLQHVYVAFASANPELTEIQFIDARNNGRELVRVYQSQNGIVAVPTKQLQEQGSRDFFVLSLKLQPGEVYLSDLKRAKDNSNVQEPVIPTLRVVTPVFGPDGTIFGLIVVNLNANFLLNQLKADLPRRLRV
jgi:two-component system, sensor histidine kinase and response regulator